MTVSNMRDRMVENEAIFRKYNENVQKGLDDLCELAEKSGQEPPIEPDDLTLHFYCECSDENCSKRIVMKPSIYKSIHKNRKRFIVIPGHEAPDIETIHKKQKDYTIVEKLHMPSDSPGPLQQTSLDNS